VTARQTDVDSMLFAHIREKEQLKAPHNISAGSSVTHFNLIFTSFSYST
jgi:hypothetical protein